MKLRITLLLIIYTILSYGCANMVDFNDDISSSTSSGDFELVLNRSTGVAPLTVFFDAEDYGANYFESVDEPFHDLEYRWTFGDDEDATWDYGTRPGEISKNEATGPVAAHVFEEAGEYTVEVEIFDGTDSYTEEVQITVYDPDCDDENDPLYDPDQSFENTVLVANNESDFDWNDYKEFHEEWDEEDWDKFDKYVYTEFDTALSEALADGGRRILFKSGQTFDFSSQTTVDVDSPVLIGSFGSGDNPIISLNESFTGYFAVFATSDDIRFMDFEIDGNELTDPTPIRGMYLGGDNCLALRLY
ncbi:MAG: PKD domain-containing protein, partial [Spirochaetales bacterium]|nr:PKD domain-containing protein [Spirochaetales bacterium]